MAKLLGPDFLNLQVRDLAASRAFYMELHAKMEAKGVAIIQQPFDGPFGRTFVLLTPMATGLPPTRTPGTAFLWAAGKIARSRKGSDRV